MPVKDKVQSFQFNRRITIQANTPTHDASGTKIDNWTDVYSCWADIQNYPHGRQLTRLYHFSQFYPNVTLMIAIRFQKSVVIDVTKRVKYTAHRIDHFYSIEGVENPNEANVSLFLLCSEPSAKAVN
jgi:SPP1 family predicted phage head-tail adaptor